MKARKRLISVALVLAMALSLVPVLSATAEASSPTQLTFGVPVSGTLSSDELLHVFTLEVPQGGGRVTLDMTGSRTHDMRWGLTLRDMYGNELISRRAVATFGLPWSSDGVEVGEGTYTIEVHGPARTGTLDFNLTATFAPSGRTAVEPNDTVAQARALPPLATGQSVTGFFSIHSDMDIFRIVVANRGDVSVSVTVPANRAIGSVNIRHPLMRLLNENGVEITRHNMSRFPSTHIWNDIEPGTYFIELSRGESLHGIYTLAVQLPAPTPPPPAFPFVDSQNHWARGYIEWAVNNGVTGGTTATTFSPNDNVTRAQFVTFLWRMAGEPTTPISTRFTDVSPSNIFIRGISWADHTGVTRGTTATTFAPNDYITREQMATMLYNYMRQLGRNVNFPSGILNNFHDGGTVSYWAQNGVSWAAHNEIMGVGGTVDPRGNASRGQTVAMLSRMAASFNLMP